MIIWGYRTYVSVLAVVNLVCRRCGNPAAHRVLKHTRKFTLFFIPLFPISVNRSMSCTFCGQATRLSQQEADNIIQGAQAQQPQHPQYQQQYPAQQPYPAQQAPQPPYPQQPPAA